METTGRDALDLEGLSRSADTDSPLRPLLLSPIRLLRRHSRVRTADYVADELNKRNLAFGEVRFSSCLIAFIFNLLPDPLLSS